MSQLSQSVLTQLIVEQRHYVDRAEKSAFCHCAFYTFTYSLTAGNTA